MRVPAPHVQAGVMGWAAEDHGQESLLLGGLSVHIHPFEEGANPIIGKDFPIEGIHRGFDRRLPAKLFKKCRLLSWSAHNYALIVQNMDSIVNRKIASCMQICSGNGSPR
jgi:hypothetical protein